MRPYAFVAQADFAGERHEHFADSPTEAAHVLTQALYIKYDIPQGTQDTVISITTYPLYTDIDGKQVFQAQGDGFGDDYHLCGPESHTCH